MSDAKDTPEAEGAPKKKKGKIGKILVMAAGVVVLLGGGVGAGLYAANSGLIGGHSDKAGAEEAADAHGSEGPAAERDRQPVHVVGLRGAHLW